MRRLVAVNNQPEVIHKSVAIGYCPLLIFNLFGLIVATPSGRKFKFLLSVRRMEPRMTVEEYFYEVLLRNITGYQQNLQAVSTRQLL